MLPKYFLIGFGVIAISFLHCSEAGNLICFYDSGSFFREGTGQFTVFHLEPALQFCNVLIYGYAGIDSNSFELKSLHTQLDIGQNHYKTITALKNKFSNLRVLLSVGGDHDIEPDGEENKYLALLEDTKKQRAFIDSVMVTLRTYGFDGVDFAWQFPKNHPKEVKSGLKKVWGAVKGWFRSPKPVDEKSEDHKREFTALVREMRSSLNRMSGFLSLTILPNVDASLFVDVFTVSANVDFVNLATFDFQTPERNPKVADHTAPIYELYERDPSHNINYQVEFWLNNTAAASIINIGVPAFGRAWNMSRDSGITGYPPVPNTEGVAPAGKLTGVPGLLSWPEICVKLYDPNNNQYSNKREPLGGEDAPLRKVGDPRQRYGIYAYRAADDDGQHGLWVSYEDPASAANKAKYVSSRGLGGVALFDLSLDDFRGDCAGEKYPILRSIKYKL